SLKRIVYAREDGNALVALADVDIADDRRRCDPAKAYSEHVVQVGHRPDRGALEDPAGIEEGSDLQVDVRRERIEREHVLTQLDVGGEGIAVVEARGAVAPQCLR